MRIIPRPFLVLAAATAMLATGSLPAQDSQLLLQKLVEKGILTRQEADALLKQQVQEQRTLLQQAPSDLPSWVKRLNLQGDLRLRAQYVGSNGAGTPGRELFRYRLRYGIVATLTESWTVGFRLASGSDTDPISTNENLGDDGLRDPVNIDQAYVLWTPRKALKLSMGKMPNPMKFGPAFEGAIMDGDLNPEGLGLNYVHSLSDSTQVGLNAAVLVIAESKTYARDAYAGLIQATLSSKLTSRFDANLGLGTYSLWNRQTIAALGLYENRGNTYSNNAPLHAMNPLIADGSLTYMVGAFPITLGGVLIHNPGASEKNDGFMVGVTLGKANRAGTWEVGWQFRELQADALYDRWADSDFGAYGVGGTTSDYKAGTNVRGHLLRFQYQLADAWTLASTFYRAEAIGTNGHPTTRAQFDLIWKF